MTFVRCVQQVQFGVQRRNPPLKHHPTRARHGEQVAVPRRLRGVGGHGTVGAVGVDEVDEVGQQSYVAMTSGPRRGRMHV